MPDVTFDPASALCSAPLVDIAPRGTARQSSRGKAGRQFSPQEAVGNDLSAEFAFHTASEPAPWWSLDLGEEWPIERIVLHNRRNTALWHRARRLRAEVSRDGIEWLTLHEGFLPFGGAGMGDPLILPLNGRILARHLRLSLAEPGILHLAGVQVFVRQGIIACRRFATAHGFDLNRPITGFDPVDFEAPYVIVAATPAGMDSPLVGACIRRYGRFGNNVNQTLNAIRVCQFLGLRTLRLTHFPGLGLSEPVTRDGLTLLPPNDPLPANGAFLDGDFHYQRQFGALFEGFDRAAQYALARDWLQPLLRFPVVTAPPAPTELVIHLRAGDIFGSEPHPNYIQPPLSYYQSVIRSLHPHEIDRVCLVFEDRGNPCIPALEAWLVQSGLPYRVQSGSVEEDVAFLLQARHLVFGTGTFGAGVCMLASAIATVHAFDRWRLYEGLPNIGRLRLARDAMGGYIPDRGWQNTPVQRQLMLDYPATSLAFSDA